MKPVVLLFPWLGAPNDAISKYVEIYEAASCDVIIKTVSLFDFLWPAHGIKSCKNFIEENSATLLSPGQPVIIHSMSVGCYFYSILLFVLNANKTVYSNLAKNIKGQVLDSPVVGSLNEMALGVTTTSIKSKLGQTLFRNLTLLYFGLSKPCTVNIYNKLIDIIKYQTPCVPSLIMTSIGDPLSSLEAFNNLTACWKSNNIPYVSKIWKDSYHVQHLRFYPTLYKALIKELICRMQNFRNYCGKSSKL